MWKPPRSIHPFVRVLDPRSILLRQHFHTENTCIYLRSGLNDRQNFY